MSAPVAAACRASSTVSRTFVLAGHASTSAPGLMLRTSSTATSNSFGAWQDTAHVAVYEIVNGYYSTYADAYENIVSDNVARVVSTSYGSAEEDWNEDGYATGTGTGRWKAIRQITISTWVAVS